MSTYIPMFTSTQGETEVMNLYQAVLNNWTTPCEELTISTSFGETHVIASGPVGAPPVVLLHALLASAMSWYRNASALSQSYRVYAVDVIGEGNRSRPTRPITSLDDFLHWFTEVINSLGIDTLYLAGNSYGGFTGAYYAMKLPERIRKLVLIGPAMTLSPMRPFFTHMFIPKALYGFFPKAPGVKRAMRKSVDWMHSNLPRDPLWEPLFYHLMVYGRLINQVFPRIYSQEEFARLKAKTMLLLGEQEIIYNNLQSAIRSAKDLIPGVRVEMIPAAHHITALANSEMVNQKLLEFFAE